MRTPAFIYLSWAMIGALTLLCAGGWTVPDRVSYVPLAASLLLFGLPHGAVDHLVVPRLLGLPPRPAVILAVATAYLALAGVYLALWYAAPNLAFALFIALTWFHWGQGDLQALLAQLGVTHLISPRRRGLALLVRGGLPMLVPLLAFPETYRAMIDATVGLFAPQAAGRLDWAFAPPFRLVAGASLAAALVVALVAGWHAAGVDGRRGWATDVAETVALAAYFAVVPPVLAVGCYFCLWHAPRHIARLVAVDRAATPAGGLSTRQALGHFTRRATPTTLAAVLLLGGLAIAVPYPPGDPASLAGLYLVLLAALTLPHTLVVTWMDRRQKVWCCARLGSTPTEGLDGV
jgi:Brp/Blh family beta-carotene 15,15'-monooxygenase